MNDYWILDVKGSHESGYEIAAVRKSFNHGFSSYGWFGDDKICIARIKTDKKLNSEYSKKIFAQIRKTAKELVDSFNIEEYGRTSYPKNFEESKKEMFEDMEKRHLNIHNYLSMQSTELLGE
jgi:hypothetical protein